MSRHQTAVSVSYKQGLLREIKGDYRALGSLMVKRFCGPPRSVAGIVIRQ